MPVFRNYELCTSVFKTIDIEKSIYKIDCRCFMYNPNTAERLTDYIKGPAKKCDRTYGFSANTFLAEFEPDMDELQTWESDFRGKVRKLEKKVNKYLKKKKSCKIDKKGNKNKK